MTVSRVSGKWVRILLHGRSADRPDFKESVHQARRSGHHVEVRLGWESGDMRRLACEAVEEGVEALVAGGGERTVNEVVSGLLKATDLVSERPSLGIMPLGTANAFARSCAIPSDPTRALNLVCSSKGVPIDVVRSEDRVVVNVAVGGIGPEVTERVNVEFRNEFHGAGFFIACLNRWKALGPVRAGLCGPGFEWKGAFPILAIGNAREIAGGYALCPRALIDDGLMDLRILPEISEEETAELIQELLAHGPDAIERRVVQARVPWVEADFEDAHRIDLDGEPQIRNRFRFEVEPRSLRFHLPEGAPVLRPPAQRSAEIKSFREYAR